MDSNPWPPSLGPDPDDDPEPTPSRPAGSASPAQLHTPGAPITAPMASTTGSKAETASPEKAVTKAVGLPAQRPAPPQPADSWPAAELVLARQAGAHRKRRMRWPYALAFGMVVVLVAVAAGYLVREYAGWPADGSSGSKEKASPTTSHSTEQLVYEPGAPAQIYGPVITAADNLYSYPVPDTGDFDTNVLFKGESPDYETSVASVHGSIVVKKYGLSVDSAEFDLEQAVVAEVQFLGGVVDVSTQKVDGHETIIVLLENVYGEEGHAIIAFVLLDRDEGTVLRVEGADYAQGQEAEYRNDSWQIVLTASRTLIDSLRVGITQ